jgi:hypothetical protein
MAGFGGLDDLINEATTNGKTFRQDWTKNMLPTTVAIANEASFLARGAGSPGADALFNTGTNLLFQQVKDTTTNAASIPHGGDVSPDYKYLLNASTFTAAATVAPCIMMLVDVVGFYRVTSVTTTTAQSTTNTLASFSTFTADAGTDVCTHSNINLMPYTRVRLTTTTTLPAGLSLATDYYVIKVTDLTCKFATSYANAVAGTAINITDAGTGTHTINTLLPRYTNGAGLKAFMYNSNATALGAATPNLSIGYTNSAQAGSRATPTTLPIGKTACPNGQILYSGATAVGKYQTFMPMQSGDSGIAQIDTIQNSTSYVSGEYSTVLCKPLITMPITTLGVASERQFISQVAGGAPRIYDGAALYWIIIHGAATPVNSSISGHMDFAWS